MDIHGILLVGTMIMMGVILKWTWLSLIGVLLLAGYLYAATKTRPAPSGGSKPKIRPIIVKRKYETESIYPKKMAVKLVPKWYTGTWWELGLETMGTFLGKLIQRAKK